MAVIGKVEIQADKDVVKNVETKIIDLFTFEERIKKFSVNYPVKMGETKLIIKVDKLEPVEFVSDAMLPAGFSTSVATLMKWGDMDKKVKALEHITKGEILSAAIEQI